MVAPGLNTEAKIAGARAVGANGYTTDVLSEALIGGAEDEE